MDNMPDEDFSQALLDQIFSLWVEPELARQGLPADRNQIRAAIIVLPPAGEAVVRINDEAHIVASVKAKGPIEAGDPVTLAQIETIERVYPAELDPNSGWICFARVADTINIAFDFRRNRARALRLVELGHLYLTTAEEARDSSRWGPAIENGFAAAELAVKAEMHLIEDAPPRRHDRREQHWRQWANLGNVPEAHAETLGALGRARAAARYGDADIAMTPEQVHEHLKVVTEMLRHATDQIGEGLLDHREGIAKAQRR